MQGSSLSEAFPGHARPPKAGAGSLHALVRVVKTVGPQAAHVPVVTHVDQIPSTKSRPIVHCLLV